MLAQYSDVILRDNYTHTNLRSEMFFVRYLRKIQCTTEADRTKFEAVSLTSQVLFLIKFLYIH